MPEKKADLTVSEGGGLDIPKTLLIMGLAAAAAPAIDRGMNALLNKVEEHSRQNKENESWLKLISKYPDLAYEDYQGNRELFASLHSLFPRIADRPEAIVGAMRIAKDYSTGGLDPSTIGTLSKATSDIESSKRPYDPSRGTMTGVTSTLSAIENANKWGLV